jgi:hypothetical protein
MKAFLLAHPLIVPAIVIFICVLIIAFYREEE